MKMPDEPLKGGFFYMSSTGYIKFYRSVTEHPLLSNDNNAYIVFTKLLTKVDRHTGSIALGRKKLALLCNLKPSTAWGVVGRLQADRMLTVTSTTSYSTIHICNWHKYQNDLDSLLDHSPTQSRQQTDSKPTLYKKEKKKEKEEYTSTFYQIVTAIGQSDQVKFLDGRRIKLKKRLETFSPEDIITAAGACGKDQFMTGENPQNQVYATVDYILKTDENVDKWLAKVVQQSSTGPPKLFGYKDA